MTCSVANYSKYCTSNTVESQLSQPLGTEVLHKYEKSLTLKLCINTVAIKNFLKKFSINYPNRTVTTLIEQSFL